MGFGERIHWFQVDGVHGEKADWSKKNMRFQKHVDLYGLRLKGSYLNKRS